MGTSDKQRLLLVDSQISREFSRFRFGLLLQFVPEIQFVRSYFNRNPLFTVVMHPAALYNSLNLLGFLFHSFRSFASFVAVC